jgi:hypothetical protein
MKSVFVWVSLITGVLPGMAVILNGFGTPEELRTPFGIIAAVCGFVAFGVVALIKETGRRRSRRVLAVLIIAFGLVGLVSLCAYWIILDQCVFQAPERSAVFFPLWLDGRAKEIVNSEGGRKAFYKKYGAGGVSILLQGQADELIWTKSLLLVLISTASVALPVSSGIASAFHDGRSAATPSGSSSGRTARRRKAPSNREAIVRNPRETDQPDHRDSTSL